MFTFWCSAFGVCFWPGNIGVFGRILFRRTRKRRRRWVGGYPPARCGHFRRVVAIAGSPAEHLLPRAPPEPARVVNTRHKKRSHLAPIQSGLVLGDIHRLLVLFRTPPPGSSVREWRARRRAGRSSWARLREIHPPSDILYHRPSLWQEAGGYFWR